MNRLILTIHWPKSHISAHAICIIFLLSWSHAFAEDNTLLGTSNNDIVALLDEPRNFLSYNLLNFSDSIDQIFSNTENFSSDNSSYARLSVASVWLDEGRPYPLTDAYIYFSLPRTEDRFSLLLQTDAAEDSDSDGVNLLPGSPSRKSNALALRGNIISGTTWHITADIGTKLSTTLDPFVR
ncbi:MAG: hypothetical protein OEX12_15455, partial [Gammaproteobacteria bacterium]|nr:hypothetical protein [Gammaproteobacteria bacterium]